MSENVPKNDIQMNPWITSVISSGIVVAIITLIGNVWVQNMKTDLETEQSYLSATQVAIKQSFNTTQASFENDINALNAQLAIQEQDLEERKQAFDEEIERLQANLQEQQVALAQSRFDEEQRFRRAAVIEQWVPLLFSNIESERQAALAVLFSTYPNEARSILESVKASQSEASVFDPQVEFINTAIESAIELDQSVGDWSIVVNSYDELGSAISGVKEAEDVGYSPTIYLLNEKYDVIVGKYPTKEDAQSAVIPLRTKLNESAFVINLNEKCPIKQDRPNYTVCVKPTPTPSPTPETTPEPPPPQ
jgi:hypothetical protein